MGVRLGLLLLCGGCCLSGCQYHSLGFVSVARIHQVAHQHGLVLD